LSTEHPHSQHFAECLHTPFEIRAPGGGTVTFVLIRVSEKRDSPKLEQFSLIFQGPMTPLLPQQILTLKHDKLGELSLFFVPIGPLEEGGMGYEVIFNRYVRAQPNS